jgi:hypothetical protein
MRSDSIAPVSFDAGAGATRSMSCEADAKEFEL